MDSKESLLWSIIQRSAKYIVTQELEKRAKFDVNLATAIYPTDLPSRSKVTSKFLAHCEG